MVASSRYRAGVRGAVLPPLPGDMPWALKPAAPLLSTVKETSGDAAGRYCMLI